MRKAELAGTVKVFSFTLMQQLRNRANIVSIVVLMLFALLAMPVITLISGGGSIGQQNGFDAKTVYIDNQIGFDLPCSLDGSGMRSTELVFGAPETLEDDAVCIGYHRTAAGYEITYQYGSLVSFENRGELEACARQWLEAGRLADAGISDAQLALLSAGVAVSTDDVSDYLAADAIGWDTRFGVSYVYGVIAMVLCIFAMTYIVRIVVEEKSSKLVELLMVSVQPLALILGKILAMMVYIFGMFALLLLSGAAGKLIATYVLHAPPVSAMLEGVDFGALRLGADTIVIVAISLLLAYSTYSLLAGLSGACCTKLEDTNAAMTLGMTLVMAGYMVSMFTGAVNSHVVAVFLTLCPFLSIFCAPTQYVIGNVGLPLLILSWVIQGAVVVLLAGVTARVYRQLILSRGTRIRFKELLVMAGLRKEAH